MSAIEDSWYPSCVVKLTIRYDESIQITRPRDEIDIDAIAAQTQEARISGQNTRATAGGDRTSPTGTHRPRRALDDAAAVANLALAATDQRLPTSSLTPGAGGVTPRGGTVPTSEIEPLTMGTDGFTVIANRVPRKGTFTLPHPRSAPQFTLMFDYSEFPVDAALIRAVGVEIHLGSVSAEDFARGMRGEVDEDGRPFSILKTTTDVVDPFTGRKMINDATLLFYGTADTWDVEHSENSSTVTIEGREIRAILLDTKVSPGDVAKVKLNNPIVEVIGDIIQTVPFENSFRLVAATIENEWPNGIVPSPGDADGMTAVRVTAASRPSAKTSSGVGSQTGDKSVKSTPDNGGKASYWDLITNYCELVGGMPHIIGSMLWIRPVHRIFDIVDPNSKIPTPFAGGIARPVGEEQIRVRRMVLGRNIKRLKLSRKFGGVAVVPTVQTIGFDDKGSGKQRLIFGQWPPSGSDAADAKADSELMRVPMWGITSVDRLTQIARGIYEEIGRGETGGTAETSVLASMGGDNGDADMLRLRPLEPVEFVVETSALRSAMPIAANVNRLASMSFSEEVAELHERLGDLALARSIVALARGAVREVIRYYQVVGVQFDWDKGIKTTMTFQNYVIPRHGAAAPSDTAKTAPKKVTTRTVKVPGAGKKAKVKTAPAPKSPDELGSAIDAIDTAKPHVQDAALRIGLGVLGINSDAVNATRPTRPRKL